MAKGAFGSRPVAALLRKQTEVVTFRTSEEQGSLLQKMPLGIV